MLKLIKDSWETYKNNAKLVQLFSIPFLISFLIPLLAPMPTYITGGAIFLRSASIFLNLNVVGLAAIVISLFLSLLFLSFAFVAISLIVKAKRTYTKHAESVIRGIEKYTARVFVVLLAYAVVLVLANILSYSIGLENVITPIVGFFFFMAIFYAPTAIVIENKGICAALGKSLKLVAKEPQQFILWVVLITAVISVLDFVAIAVTGTLISRYVLLLINSLFVMPYFVIYQAEAYMKRFSLLKH